MSKSVLETYDPKEELFNAYSHGAGVVMAVVASIFLIIKGSYLPTAQWVGLWVYSFSLILVLPVLHFIILLKHKTTLLV